MNVIHEDGNARTIGSWTGGDGDGGPASQIEDMSVLVVVVLPREDAAVHGGVAVKRDDSGSILLSLCLER